MDAFFRKFSKMGDWASLVDVFFTYLIVGSGLFLLFVAPHGASFGAQLVVWILLVVAFVLCIASLLITHHTAVRWITAIFFAVVAFGAMPKVGNVIIPPGGIQWTNGIAFWTLFQAVGGVGYFLLGAVVGHYLAKRILVIADEIGTVLLMVSLGTAGFTFTPFFGPNWGNELLGWGVFLVCVCVFGWLFYTQHQHSHHWIVRFLLEPGLITFGVGSLIYLGCFTVTGGGNGVVAFSFALVSAIAVTVMLLANIVEPAPAPAA